MYPVDFLYKAALHAPDAVAVEDDHQQISYWTLVQRANALAAGYQKVAKKDRVKIAVLAPNSVDLFVAIMAIHASGAILVPLNPRVARPEIDKQIEAADPDLIVVDPSCLDGFSPARATPIVIGMRGSGELSTNALAAAHDQEKPSWPAVTLSDINGVKFTGGSSGKPKAVMQSFRVVNTVIVNIMTAFEFKSDECNLVAAPMAHGASMFMLPTLARGGKNIISGTTKPEVLVDSMERFGVTCFWLPPTLLYSLLEVQGVRTRDFRKLRHIIYGGASASPEKLREAQRLFGPVVEATYGQTEAAICTALRGKEMMNQDLLTSVGLPMALTQVRIQDPDGNALPAGELGEIAASGDVLMNGYLGMPEETSKTIVGGWVRTGDVGYMDSRGNLFIKDRIRDVVISGGLNIYPSDIEAMLSRHEAVLEAVVFGVADEKWGERLEAAVQLKPAANATAEDLIAFVRSLIGPVKAPKRVHLVAELPRSPVGKVLRREAKAQFSSI